MHDRVLYFSGQTVHLGNTLVVCNVDYGLRMIGLLIFIALPLVGIAAAIVVVGLRRRSTARDDARRVGDESSADPHDAAQSAGGRAAWMRGDF